MYAIVKTGGKQYKVAVGDVVTVEKLDAAPGDSVALPAILLVDGEQVTTDAAALAGVSVTGEVLGAVKGPIYRPYSRNSEKMSQALESTFQKKEF